MGTIIPDSIALFCTSLPCIYLRRADRKWAIAFLLASFLTAFLYSRNEAEWLTLLLFGILSLICTLGALWRQPIRSRGYLVVSSWGTAYCCLCTARLLASYLMPDEVFLGLFGIPIVLLLTVPSAMLGHRLSRWEIGSGMTGPNGRWISPIPLMLIPPLAGPFLVWGGQYKLAPCAIVLLMSCFAISGASFIWTYIVLTEQQSQHNAAQQKNTLHGIEEMGKALEDENASTRVKLAAAKARLSAAKEALDNRDHERLSSILQGWDLPAGNQKTFCALPLIDGVMRRYDLLARQSGLKTDISLRIYRLSEFPEADVSYLVSTMLENVMLLAGSGERIFRVRMEETMGRLVIVAGCSHRGDRAQDCTQKLRYPVENCRMWCEQTVEAGMFRLSVILYPRNKK